MQKRDPDFNFDSYLESTKGMAVEKLYNQLKKLPFFATVQAQISLEEFKDVSTPEGFFNAFVEVLLFDEQLQFPQLPKSVNSFL